MARMQNTSSLIIKRTAVDPSGHLGSLYDACQDRVLQPLDIMFDKTPGRFYQKAQCSFEKGDKNQSRNLLQLIDIDEQLRFSLLLDLEKKCGIATVIDQPNILNEYTRVLHYSYVYREECLPDELKEAQEWLKISVPKINATHIIVGVSWGVDIVIILQLPPEDNLVSIIDDTLEKYRVVLNGDQAHFKLTRDDLNLYKNIISTKVYSNIPELNKITTLHGLFHNISRFRLDISQHRKLVYTLRPISNTVYKPLISPNNTKLEQYLYELTTSIKTIETYFHEDMLKLLCGHFKQRLSDAYGQWPDVKKECINVIQSFFQLIIEIRCNRSDISMLDRMLNNGTLTLLRNNVHDLTQNVTDLNVKGHLISDLGNQHIQYCNVIERHVNENDNEDTLKRKLMIDEKIDRILCSNDFLNMKNPAQLIELRHTLVQELEKNSKLRLIYADFSYSSFELHHMMVLSSSKNNKKKKNTKHKESLSSTTTNNTLTSFTKPRISISSSPSKLPTTDTINILLLGETGVGKSTFINALVNYLTFKTLNIAQSNKPIVAIPVSFLITVGNNFEEHTIKFGNMNSSSNEDFNHPGQSVTQKCRCHVYHPVDKNGKKLRIIDTPGFGDTRGLDQDDHNMKHIVEYITNFSHVNAICFLLRPNESRLNIYFQSCLTQLFNLLGPGVRNHIIFCFTNSRTTFYTPGNTATLLKDILSSLSIRGIPYKKDNTFCFDSESFRYLVALQNKVPFTDLDKQEYEMSWTNSVREANRFTSYISKNLTAYPIPNERQAIKNAQVEITQMVHPIVECTRNILRSIIISKINSQKPFIEPPSNDPSSHQLQNLDHIRQRLSHQPILLEFLQDYKTMNGSLSQKQDNRIDQLLLLCHVSAEFGHFLMHMTHSSQQDPFLAGLKRLIEEENTICKNQNRHLMNLQLVECLKKLASNYEQNTQNIESNSKRSTLSDINEWIKYMRKYPLISEYVIGNYQAITSYGNIQITIL